MIRPSQAEIQVIKSKSEPPSLRAEIWASFVTKLLKGFVKTTSWVWGGILRNPTLVRYHMLPKYQPKRGSDLGWGKLFRFKCGIKNYLQIANVDLANVWSQFNCNIDMIGN